MSSQIRRSFTSKSCTCFPSLRWQRSAVHLPLVPKVLARFASSTVVATNSFMGFSTGRRLPSCLPCLINTPTRNEHQDTSSSRFSATSMAPSAASMSAVKALHTGVRGPTLAMSSRPTVADAIH
ncbi:unnamed protein product, partial [Ectocarpus fasciculatus]